MVLKTKGRFEHTYRNIAELKNHPGHIGFVRWQRKGHPDNKIPELFERENLESLQNVLAAWLGHERFSLLMLRSSIVSSASIPETEIIESWERWRNGVSASIRERKGFDGNGQNDYRGDTLSWAVCLEKFTREITDGS